MIPQRVKLPKDGKAGDTLVIDIGKSAVGEYGGASGVGIQSYIFSELSRQSASTLKPNNSKYLELMSSHLQDGPKTDVGLIKNVVFPLISPLRIYTRNGFWTDQLSLQGNHTTPRLLGVHERRKMINHFIEIENLNGQISDEEKLRKLKTFLREEVFFLLKNKYEVYKGKDLPYIQEEIRKILKECTDPVASANVLTNFNQQKLNYLSKLRTDFDKANDERSKERVIKKYIADIVKKKYDKLLARRKKIKKKSKLAKDETNEKIEALEQEHKEFKSKKRSSLLSKVEGHYKFFLQEISKDIDAIRSLVDQYVHRLADYIQKYNDAAENGRAEYLILYGQSLLDMDPYAVPCHIDDNSGSKSNKDSGNKECMEHYFIKNKKRHNLYVDLQAIVEKKDFSNQLLQNCPNLLDVRIITAYEKRINEARQTEQKKEMNDRLKFFIAKEVKENLINSTEYLLKRYYREHKKTKEEEENDRKAFKNTP